ncbi:Cell division control protein 45-like protein [Trichoplax sp. H2]|nr:Cell division control protein 45-like protein [Trichoplax sp. H2]|eukprot:RDD44749.1 Cell division control protein 45-like protein [Trichoplax sp. H2]
MFIANIKQEFYNAILYQRVLIIAVADCDSLCSCKILQSILHSDNIGYTLVPVSGLQELERVYLEYSDQFKNIILINCGGNINIVEILQPEEDVTFYVIDSHRPFDLNNVFNQDQVKIILMEGETVDIPDFDDVFRQNEDEEDDDDDRDNLDNGSSADEEIEGSPRKRMKTDTLSKRRWLQRRKEILFSYYEFAYYGTASAMIAFDLAWKLSKDNNDNLWWTIIGLTEQYLHQKIDRDKYVLDVSTIQGHVMRLNRTSDESGLSINCMKIGFENDLRLVLYKHWSLYESFYYSLYTACKFRIWTMKGKKNLHELLAEIGIPVKQAMQKFSSMDMEYKINVKEWIENLAQKFGLSDITFGSFRSQFGYKTKFTAADAVYGLIAIIEDMENPKPLSDKFLEALDSLSRSKCKTLSEGIRKAKLQQIAIFKQVRNFIDMRQVVCAGPFLYACIDEGSSDKKIFCKPTTLGKLARFLLTAYVASSRNKLAASLPMVLVTPLDTDRGTSLVLGIPPIAEDTARKAFEQAAEKTKARTLHDCFDSSIIEIKSEDRGKFFDALSALLA